jgi:hypothetical protein
MGLSVDAIEINGPRGVIRLRWAAPGVFFGELVGDIDTEMGPPFAAALHELFTDAPEGAVCFWDAAGFERYTSDFRRAATEVLGRHWRRLGKMRVLVTSPIVRMGVAVASIAVQTLCATNDRAEFEAELAAAIEAAKRP